MRTKLKFIKNVIYKLERSYGRAVDFHIVDQHQTDPVTGNKTSVLQVIKINRAVILRARESRSFVYDLAYISANKDFTTGGFFDPEDRRIIIRSEYLNGHVPEIDDYIVVDNKEYNIIEIFKHCNTYAYEFLTKRVKGSLLVRIVGEFNVLTLQQSAEAELVGRLERSLTSELDFSQDLKEVP